MNNLPSDIAHICAHVATLERLTCTVLRPDELSDQSGSWHAIILTGTDVPPQCHMGRYDAEIEMIREVSCPVLGICGGHQILAIAFGGVVGRLDQPVYGRVKVKAQRGDAIVERLGGEFTVFSKHRFYVQEVPRSFDVIATDALMGCAYIVRHRERPLYGVQFHPERRNQGTQILRNFLGISRRHQQPGN